MFDVWSGSAGSERHTCEEVSDLLDETSQLLVALVHPLFGSVGLHQHVVGVQLGLVSLLFGLRHLNTVERLEHRSGSRRPDQTGTCETHHLGEFLHFLHGADYFLLGLLSRLPGVAGRRHDAVTSFASAPGQTFGVHTAQTSTVRRQAGVLA